MVTDLADEGKLKPSPSRVEAGRDSCHQVPGNWGHQVPRGREVLKAGGLAESLCLKLSDLVSPLLVLVPNFLLHSVTCSHC